MSAQAPRVTTGYGSAVPSLQRQAYGEMQFPQSGTLPIRRRRPRGLSGADDPALGSDAAPSGNIPAIDLGAVIDDGGLPVSAGDPIQSDIVLRTTSEAYPIPWELMILGGIFLLLLDDKKGGSHV